MTDNYL